MCSLFKKNVKTSYTKTIFFENVYEDIITNY